MAGMEGKTTVIVADPEMAEKYNGLYGSISPQNVSPVDFYDAIELDEKYRGTFSLMPLNPIEMQLVKKINQDTYDLVKQIYRKENGKPYSSLVEKIAKLGNKLKAEDKPNPDDQKSIDAYMTKYKRLKTLENESEEYWKKAMVRRDNERIYRIVEEHTVSVDNFCYPEEDQIKSYTGIVDYDVLIQIGTIMPQLLIWLYKELQNISNLSEAEQSGL
jgi:hypothetical protein